MRRILRFFQTFNDMKTNSEIRLSARETLKGKWGGVIVPTLVYGLLAGVIAAIAQGDSALLTLVYLALAIGFLLPLGFGFTMMFLHFVRDGKQPTVGGLFGAFNETYYKKSVITMLLVGIYTFLWSLLLLVPGIIKSLSYSMTAMILAENPELGANEAIDRSIAMMDGHKMDLFLILLGYAGLALLSALLLFIPLLWIAPFYNTVLAKFYLELKNESAA